MVLTGMKSRCRGLETATHITSTLEGKEESTHAFMLFNSDSSIPTQFRTQSQGMVLPTYMLECPISINTIGQSPTDMATDRPDLDNPSLRFFSQVILSCAKLTMKTNHHECICHRNLTYSVHSHYSVSSMREENFSTFLVSKSTQHTVVIL